MEIALFRFIYLFLRLNSRELIGNRKCEMRAYFDIELLHDRDQKRKIPYR